ncbi:galactokinase [Vagococcus sp.]|uniref:galactokinase n=1 Tax=Vagococcus sp. TaxID=1933889 RepID=UPI003F9A9788
MEHLTARFKELFHTEPDATYFSPGRINLIGEHTDYNGGHVFPASITLGTYGLAKKRDDNKICLYSENFPEKGIIEFSLEDLDFNQEHSWTNYPKAVLKYLKEAGHSIDNGLDILVYGNIPNGAGLSSSASLELLMGVILEDQFKLSVERLDLILIGKRVENEFIGVNSGIMDQFAIGMGAKDQAILLDTNTLSYELVPADFGDYVIAIMNTNKRRELIDSKYNERRAECEKALSLLQTKLDIQSLGELSATDFKAHLDLINDDLLIKRAKHAITENERTLIAKKALENHDLVEFGLLLNASHDSLKNDYEVTGIELDTLVDAARRHTHVLGARMTGAGFGGCAIALVHKEHWDTFVEDVKKEYLEIIGYDTEIYQASIGSGTTKLS